MGDVCLKYSDLDKLGMVNDICVYYNYGRKKRDKLMAWSGDRLYAMRQAMKERGQLNGFFKTATIHIDVIMKELGANSYIHDYKKHDDTHIIYLGRDFKTRNEFGIHVKTQICTIELNKNLKITKLEDTSGKVYKRYKDYYVMLGR